MGLERHGAEDHLSEAIVHLMAASDAARQMPDQDMLVRLIDAVLMHAGRELALALATQAPTSTDDL